METTAAAGWRFDNTYARLPRMFHVPATPAKFRAPRVVIANDRLAAELGLDLRALTAEAAVDLFAGQE